MDIRFEEAVAEARRIIADGLTTTGMDAARDRFLRQGASRRLRTDPNALIAGSTTDPAIFDHLRVAVADAIARREALLGLGTLAVDANLALAQQAVDVGPWHALERAKQEIVQSLPDISLAGLDVLHAAGTRRDRFFGLRDRLIVSH